MVSLAVTAVGTTFVTPAAEAGPPVTGPQGRLCSYSSVSDPSPDADADTMVGQTNAGPLVWDRPFTVTCTIQVDSNVHNGTTNDAYASGSASVAVGTNHVAIHRDAGFTYDSPEDSQDYLCTSVTYASGTIYWHPTDPGPDGVAGTPDDGEAGHWTTDSNKPCSAATQFSTGPFIDLLNETVFEPLDSLILCPILKELHLLLFHDPATHPNDYNGQAPIYVDDDGDVYIDLDLTAPVEHPDDLFWDCPPYEFDPTQDPDPPYEDPLQ